VSEAISAPGDRAEDGRTARLWLAGNVEPSQETANAGSRDPPFRADHVGSLLRPPELARARADFKAGRIDSEALRVAEDEATLGVIELQRQAGLRSVTDGEFRRTSWHMDFIYSLTDRRRS
jgi:5-methyltetrahydropteroyltriglutamate--homocysteine methyltransferase